MFIMVPGLRINNISAYTDFFKGEKNVYIVISIA